MYTIVKPGLVKNVSLPSYGRQDVGITAGGAMDSFSYRTGNILLGNPEDTPALEILYPPTLKFTQDSWFVLTGAACNSVRLLSGGETLNIVHARVYRASRGSTLSFGPRAYGFRTYLCSRRVDDKVSSPPEGRSRGAFGGMAHWPDPAGYIRVVEGPEYAYLNHGEKFFHKPWTIGRDCSDMGMKIENPDAELSVSMGNMVSEAVATGTVQLTPKGPIILLKHRQTVGGYPRIFNVISADVDMLGQYMPDQKIHFRKVTLAEARDVLRMQMKDISSLKNRINQEEL